MECRLAGETEVLGENLPQRHFITKSHMARPGFEPGPPRWPELWRGHYMQLLFIRVFVPLHGLRNVIKSTVLKLNVAAVCCTSAYVDERTRCNIPENNYLRSQYCENQDISQKFCNVV
jgi:hypothetical protein